MTRRVTRLPSVFAHHWLAAGEAPERCGRREPLQPSFGASGYTVRRRKSRLYGRVHQDLVRLGLAHGACGQVHHRPEAVAALDKNIAEGEPGPNRRENGMSPERVGKLEGDFAGSVDACSHEHDFVADEL